jgi:MoaA/NifB/PqqE/SkfB family radical SAM enzyme
MNLWKSLFNNNKGIIYNPIEKKIVNQFNEIRSIDKRKLLCHAPFKSMTFFHTGDVLACWYNKLFPLGKYPEDSVHDIWFSKRSDKLRDFIRHNDLSYGCADCRNALNAKQFNIVGAWRYDYLPDKKNEYPVSMDFQISNSCNYQCIMCNGEYSASVRTNRENQNQYKNPYDDNFFEQIIPFIPHLKEASFSGGEPFFANEFYKIWDLIISINPKINISLTTNGSIYNDKVLKYLNALSFNISLSLDAITESTYSKIRVNGDFNTVMKNMQIFLDYTVAKGTVFAVKICAMRQNWQELPELSTYLNKMNISFQYDTVIYPPYCSLWSLRVGRLNEILEFLKQHSLSANSFIQKQNAKRYLDLVNQIENWKDEAQKREEVNFYQLNTHQLAEMFIYNVKTYLDTKLNYLKSENPIQIEKIKELVTKLIKDSPTEEIAFLGMQYYASVPLERWLAELEIRDYEKNLDRFIQIGKGNIDVF